MKTVYCLLSLLLWKFAVCQPITEKIRKGVENLQRDQQFAHAIIGITVVDSKTGQLIYERNGQLGLAPASCQKVITSIAAFELLGKDYRYKTTVGYEGTIKDSILNGRLFINGSGDPTMGSSRWKQTKDVYLIRKIKEELSKAGIQQFNSCVINDSKWGTQTIPGGWVWEDIGNYYGAGCHAFNWQENQYSIALRAGKKVGDPVALLSELPAGMHTVINELKTAAKGTGDQAYVYNAPHSPISTLRGTIPLGADSFVISAAAFQPAVLFKESLKQVQAETRVQLTDAPGTAYHLEEEILGPFPFKGKMEKELFSMESPPLDSINYWFLRKSINLYGEALVKTIAFEKKATGATDTGIVVIKDFFSGQGIERSAINIIDGSGLSPANRVTTNALVQLMQFARGRSWYPSFYQALPEMNGIKMKDGYIGGVRAYTGFVKGTNGPGYTFAIIVNNFDGNPATAREKIWAVLDILK